MAITLSNPNATYLSQLTSLASRPALNYVAEEGAPPPTEIPSNGILEFVALVQERMQMELYGTEMVSLPIKLPLMSSYNMLSKQLETLDNKKPGTAPDATFTAAFYTTQTLPSQLATLVSQLNSLATGQPGSGFDTTVTRVTAATTTFKNGTASADAAVNTAIAKMDANSLQSFLVQEQSPAVANIISNLASISQADRDAAWKQNLFMQNSLDGTFGTGMPESVMLNTPRSFAPRIPTAGATSMNSDLVAIRDSLVAQYQIITKEEQRLQGIAVKWQRDNNFVTVGIQAQNEPDNVVLQQQFKALIERYEADIFGEYRQVLQQKQDLEMEVGQAFMNTFLK